MYSVHLCGIYFEDVAISIRFDEFCEIVSADDFNANKAFEFDTSNQMMFCELKNCKCEVHNWGHANQVSFDASNESMHILALKNGEGLNFQVLSVPFDNALRMNDAIAKTMESANSKMGAIMGTGWYF